MKEFIIKLVYELQTELIALIKQSKEDKYKDDMWLKGVIDGKIEVVEVLLDESGDTQCK